VFVNYTPELGLDKFAPAGRKGEIRVTAYHQEPDRPKIAELKLWISTDDGRLGPAQGEVPRQRRLRSRRPLPEARPDHRLSQPQGRGVGRRRQPRRADRRRAFGLREGDDDDDDD